MTIQRRPLLDPAKHGRKTFAALVALPCPECGTVTRWIVSLQRRICATCAISWRDPMEHGLREHVDAATGSELAPPLVGGEQ